MHYRNKLINDEKERAGNMLVDLVRNDRKYQEACHVKFQGKKYSKVCICKRCNGV